MQTIDVKSLQFGFTKKYFDELAAKENIKDVLEKVDTPSLVIDKEKIKSRYVDIKYYMPNVDIFYAVKANDHIDILRTLNSLGSGFEVASSKELEKVLSLGTDPSKIITSNPVKPLEFIDFAYKSHIKAFAIDSFLEVDKLAKAAPRSLVYVRIVVPNEGSDWPLTKKFGTDPETALNILDYAKSKGLIPYGITFHVGSQCNNLRNWFIGLKLASELLERARQNGISLNMLNMGGGIPIKYTYESLTIEDISYYIDGVIRKYFRFYPNEIQIEPGRGLVGDSGILVTKVIGIAQREDSLFAYVDTGVFNGLAEVLGGIRYPVYVDKDEELLEYTLAGVSCDSMDIIAKNLYLPRLELNDRLYILSAGAYTSVYAADFNGFGTPKFYFL